MESLQKKALVEIAHDFSRGDAALIVQVEAAIRTPPRTTETVGYYLSGRETEFENCFRKLTSLLMQSPYASGAEDKESLWLFSQWIGPGRLTQFPSGYVDAIATTPLDPSWHLPDADDDAYAADRPRWEQQLLRTYGAGVMSLQAAFDAAGFPLLPIDLNGGDTLPFIHATPVAAARWRDVQIGETHSGEPLAIRSPMWAALWDHLAYSLQCANVGDVLPDGIPAPPPLRALNAVPGL